SPTIGLGWGAGGYSRPCSCHRRERNRKHNDGNYKDENSHQQPIDSHLKFSVSPRLIAFFSASDPRVVNYANHEFTLLEEFLGNPSGYHVCSFS
ncbi:hypothetical protein, partial [Pseudomonas aeruginosa]|uniref:hypothetical protein n=1 Tax=Pseudomonas aeruginosa TaxID=287 RepID=UPI0031B71AD9